METNATSSIETKTLWSKLRQDLLHFVRARVPSKEIAEDITHNAFLKIAQKIDSLKHQERLVPWAYQIARNEIADYYRSSVKEEPKPLEPNQESASSPDSNYNELVSGWLPSFLEALPPSDRLLLEEVELKSISQTEAAQTRSIPYSSLKSQVQRARAKLRNLLEDCCRIERDRYGNVVDYKSKNCDC
ncbi:MAG: sigma-70 family RNA polymerase sigma factor [Verrucomicrobiota bacterium]